MAIVEAVAWCVFEPEKCLTPRSGLFTIATKVGGVPEVLPQHMLILAEPNTEGERM